MKAPDCLYYKSVGCPGRDPKVCDPFCICERGDKPMEAEKVDINIKNANIGNFVIHPTGTFEFRSDNGEPIALTGNQIYDLVRKAVKP